MRLKAKLRISIKNNVTGEYHKVVVLTYEYYLFTGSHYSFSVN